MEPLWRQGSPSWTRNEISQQINESRGKTGGEVDEIIVPAPASWNIEYEDEGEWYEEDFEYVDYRYELGSALEGACARFDILTPIPSLMDDFIRHYLRFGDSTDCLVCKTAMLRNLGREIATERDTIRNDLAGMRRRLTEAVQAETTACATMTVEIGERGSARNELVGVFNRLCKFRQWLVSSCLRLSVS